MYAFVINNPLYWWDYLGQDWSDIDNMVKKALEQCKAIKDQCKRHFCEKRIYETFFEWVDAQGLSDDQGWLDIIEAFGEGWSKGGAAAADGVIPFANPFENYYANKDGSIATEYKISRFLGETSRDLLLVSAVPNIETWAENPILYEIGQTTIDYESYQSVANLTAIERGAAFVEAAGGSYVKAAFSTSWIDTTSTVGTGLTPGGNILLIGIISVADKMSQK